MTQLTEAPRSRPDARERGAPEPGRFEPAAQRSRPEPQPVDAVFRAERAFLAMALAEGPGGREYLERSPDEHLSSEPLRRVRDWLLERFDAPLTELPVDDPAFTALVAEVVALAEEEPSSAEVLRLTFLQLELRRIDRDLRHSERAGRFDRQRELWTAREDAREKIAELMGQTA